MNKENEQPEAAYQHQTPPCRSTHPFNVSSSVGCGPSGTEVDLNIGEPKKLSGIFKSPTVEVNLEMGALGSIKLVGEIIESTIRIKIPYVEDILGQKGLEDEPKLNCTIKVKGIKHHEVKFTWCCRSLVSLAPPVPGLRTSFALLSSHSSFSKGFFGLILIATDDTEFDEESQMADNQNDSVLCTQ